MPKLTRQFIEYEARAPKRGQTLYPDSEVNGLWLRVTPRRKFFILQWYSDSDVDRSIIIGDTKNLSPERARDEAKRILAALSAPHTANSADSGGSVTLGRAFEKYILIRTLRRSTQQLYKALMRRCLNDWMPLPIAQITKNMVEERHRELCHITPTGSDGRGQANLTMKLLRAVLNFAADYYETPDGLPALTANPVKRLSQNKSWYRLSPRQGIIPDHKLSAWYKAVVSLENKTAADYLLFVLLTGFRRNEAACLRWSDVHFETRLILVPSELCKNHHAHKFPMSPFVERLLHRRYAQKKKSDYVFPGQWDRGRITDFRKPISEVSAKSNCPFVLHDLRRGFLTMAERLDVPHYALKRLANHVSLNDVTANYVVMDIERLRPHIARITDQFLALLFPDFNGTQ